MAERKASDLFVECLEAEGVEHVFGIPGEETLDLNESLEDSSITFVPVRHEQGGAYMADMYGRLTAAPASASARSGRARRTSSRPSPTRSWTARRSSRSPGQADLERMHKESHQHIDVVSMFHPVTKWNARLNSSRVIPEVVRKAFKVAQAQKPGPTHIELPEDVMADTVDAEPLPAQLRVRRPEPSARELLEAASVIRAAEQPDRARRQRRRARRRGGGAARVRARDRHRRRRDVHGQGRCSTTRTRARSAPSGCSRATTRWPGFEDADVVITVGYDLVEHSPKNWNPGRDKKIVFIDTVSAEVDEHFMTEVDLVGDLDHILSRLAEELRDGGCGAGGRPRA